VIRFNASDFNRDMKNLIGYTEGFVQGAVQAKPVAMAKIGAGVVEALKQFIDSNARANPQALHHVYEWYQEGSPDARLFDIVYTVNGLGLSIQATFRQSTVVKSGGAPFYDKARIMEQGLPVTITPKKATVLAFQQDGEQVFTAGPVNVSRPGGEEVLGSFERVFDLFVNQYFTQAFLASSGILDHLSNPSEYRQYLQRGLSSGKSAGLVAGHRWMAGVGVNI
jgi:hypothetical protein